MSSLFSQLQTFFWNIFNRPQLNDLLDILIVAVLIYQMIMLTRDTRASEVLKGFLRDELGDAQVYACLAARVPRREMSRALRAMAEDEKRHARDLAAAIYLIDGKPYSPRVCVEQPELCELCALLRRLYHAEACAGFNYARAADETLDPCLGKLLAAMSEDEYRHAGMLMKLLGRRLEL